MAIYCGPGTDIQFEVFIEDEWVILPNNCQRSMKEALSSDVDMVSLDSDDFKGTIFLNKMTYSLDNSVFKRIRCVVRKDLTVQDFYSWCYKSDSNQWKSYSTNICVSLEEAFKAGDFLKTVKILGREYSVNFQKWHQESKETGFRRSISRVMSKARKLRSAKSEPLEVKNEQSDSAVARSGQNYSKSVMKTLKGRPPVDPEALSALGSDTKCHVFTNGGDVYDVLLNQTNLSQNNNKYYIIQIIESVNGDKFWFWTRWGRVGYKGQNSLVSCGSDLAKAQKLFENKFHQKTENYWEDRNDFVKHMDKYDLIERDFGADQATVSSDETENESELKSNRKSRSKRKGLSIPSEDTKKFKQESCSVESKLHVRLQMLLEMICDVKEMEEVVVSMNYDVQKAPLGKLTSVQLKAGYNALKKIAEIVEKYQDESEGDRQISSTRKSKSGQLTAKSKSALLQACNEFYTRVPHCFGFRQPPLISTHAEVKEKLELLETLGDIEIAIHSMKHEISLGSPEHPLDKHYRNLHCSMTFVEEDSDIYKLINRYLHESHGQTHNSYTTELLEVFAVDRQDESAYFKSDIGNNMLLWHGSRMTNYYGILNQGLRIAPPEAPSTGYMFGKGVYFADSASKSANYCQTSALRNIGFVLLCKVALGKPNELLAADYKADKLPEGYNSVMGLGRFVPDKSNFATLDDGTVMPVGKLVPSKNPNSSRFSLLYNEYIVYDTHQIAMKYICKVKFNYKI